jgi:hypothetical protein
LRRRLRIFFRCEFGIRSIPVNLRIRCSVRFAFEGLQAFVPTLFPFCVQGGYGLLDRRVRLFER